MVRDDEASEHLSPEQLFFGEDHQRHLDVADALDALGARHRAVIDMRFGFVPGGARSVEDIAEWFDVSVEEAERMLEDALAALRAALATEDDAGGS